MTTKDLITILQSYDPDRRVVVRDRKILTKQYEPMAVFQLQTEPTEIWIDTREEHQGEK